MEILDRENTDTCVMRNDSLRKDNLQVVRCSRRKNLQPQNVLSSKHHR